MTVLAYPHWDLRRAGYWVGGYGASTGLATCTSVYTEVTGGTVTSSTNYSTSVPGNARDKNATTQWHSNNTPVDQWIKLNFGTAQSISRVTIQQRAESSHKFKNVYVEVSTDDAVWRPVARLRVTSPVALTIHTVDFSPVTAQYIRLRQVGYNETTDYYFVVQEWGVYGSPITRFDRNTDPIVGLRIPYTSYPIWDFAPHNQRIYWRGEYRTASVNKLGGYLNLDTGDYHLTVPDSQWHPFQCSSLQSDDANMWAQSETLGWIEFRNVVVDNDPMPMGWDGDEWRLVGDTWDGTKWRSDAEAWDGSKWVRLTQSRTATSSERWSQWMDVLEAGSAYPALRPFAIFSTEFSNYGGGGWATVKWRFSDQGQVQYQGLARTKQILTPVQIVMIHGYLPQTPVDTYGGLSIGMANGTSSWAPVPGPGADGATFRFDVQVNSSDLQYHAVLITPNGTASNSVAGEWFALNVYTDLTQGEI